MAEPVLALACFECKHRFPGDIALGVVNAHCVEEHGMVDGHPHLELRGYCPRDESDLGEPSVLPAGAGRERLDYTCPTCQGTYTVTRDAAA